MVKKRSDFSPQLSSDQAIWGEVKSGHEPSLPLSKFHIFQLIDMLNARQQRLFSCDCAELILPIYESLRPDDPVPRRAVDRFRKHVTAIPSLRKLEREFRDPFVYGSIRNYKYLDNWPPIISAWLVRLGVDWRIDHRHTWAKLSEGWTAGCDTENDAEWVAWNIFLMIRDHFITTPRSVAIMSISSTLFASNGNDNWHRKRLLEYSLQHRRL